MKNLKYSKRIDLRFSKEEFALVAISKKVLGAVIIIAILIVGISLYYFYGYLPNMENTRELEEWKNTLIIGSTDTLTNPDPDIGYSGLDAVVGWLCDAMLFKIDADEPGKFAPVLAESWEVRNNSDGELTMRFHIRHGLTFQDGTALNASAVKMGLEISAEKDESTMGDYRMITRMDVIDEYTIDFVIIDNSNFECLEFLGYWGQAMGPGMFSSPTSSVKWGEGGNIVGCGPYIFNTTEYVPNEKIVLDKWEDYPIDTHSSGAFKRIMIQQYTDPTVMRLALEKGDIDVIFPRVSKTDFPSLVNNTDLVVNTGAMRGRSRYLLFNWNYKPLDDVRVRRAIAYAIDRDEIIAGAQFGMVVPAYSVVKPSFAMYYPTFADTYSYNITIAKALLAEAGYPNGFTIDFMWMDDVDITSIEQSTVTIIKEQLARIDIDANLIRLDKATRIAKRNAGSLGGICFAFWLEDYADADTYLYPTMDNVYYSQSIHHNITHIEDLLQEGRDLYRADNPITPQRDAIYRELQEICADQVVVLPVFYDSIGSAWRTYVKNYNLTWNFFTPELTGAYKEIPAGKSTASLSASAVVTNIIVLCVLPRARKSIYRKNSDSKRVYRFHFFVR